jgi:glycine/D-amino acid oxidase-like deaminating enzyme
VLLGATKEWGSTNVSPSVGDEERSSALAKLFAEATQFYPYISRWEVIGMQAGLRAMPPRSALASLPLVGCIDDLVKDSLVRKAIGSISSSETSSKKWGIFGGLGSRGLIHHGWLGEQLARAIILKNELILPPELKQW